MHTDSTRAGVVLLGDGIENPFNRNCLIAAAQMFGSQCRFGYGRELLGRTEYSPIIALENTDYAADVFRFQLPRLAGPAALIVGNERFGISKTALARANYCIKIPMASGRLNTINVAAASAVANYYLFHSAQRKKLLNPNPRARRPDLLLLSPANSAELGSTLRSAAAFGWRQARMDDRHNVWFACNRESRASGRAAARQARNDIILLANPTSDRNTYPRVFVVTSGHVGTPLHQIQLAGRHPNLLVLPDELGVDIDKEDWARYGRSVEFVRIDLPASHFDYHYRLCASIALAECARQLGLR